MALFGAALAAVTIVVTVLIFGINEVTTPVVLPLIGALGTVMVSLASALKSAEAADTASKAHQLAELTASQTAALHQTVIAHCGEICPAAHCPLRVRIPPEDW